MTNEVTDGKSAARELAARLPGWMVWYGEHTRRYWATPRSRAAARGVLAEADTPEQLEEVVRQMTEGTPRPERAPEPHGVREIQGSETVRPTHGHTEPRHSREPVGARTARD